MRLEVSMLSGENGELTRGLVVAACTWAAHDFNPNSQGVAQRQAQPKAAVCRSSRMNHSRTKHPKYSLVFGFVCEMDRNG